MAKQQKTLEWCVVRLGEDMNWWVQEISDDVRWDVDGLGIIDPRQMSYILEICDDLGTYGLDPEIVDHAFYAFGVDGELKDSKVRLTISSDTLLEDEATLFALPDSLDEEKGPYADFLDQITKARVKKLNDLIEFEKKLTIDELEEEVRERQNAEYMEGRAVHPFAEIVAILEYVPTGYELEGDDDAKGAEEGEDIGDIPDFEEDDEKIEEDETMKWDEDEEESEDEEDGEGDDEDGDEDEEESEDDEEEEEEDEEGGAKRSRGKKRR